VYQLAICSAICNVVQVETIGDVYVMVSGLPQRNGDLHIVAIANCALELISGALSFSVPHRPNHKLRMRIGRSLSR